MQQVYWLYPNDISKLIAEVIRYFTPGGAAAVEGFPDTFHQGALLAVPGAQFGPLPPFTREAGRGAVMICLPLTSGTTEQIVVALLPGGRPASGIESVQVEINGAVQFLAGDAFHAECISVGAGVPESVLKAWIQKGAISGYHTRDDFRIFLDRRDGVG